MDGKIVAQLSEIISDKWNKIDSRDNSKSRINRILGRKKIATIINELVEFRKVATDDEKKNFPMVTLIIVLVIIMRNLDCVDELQKELKSNNLINPLYGGLYKLLCGNSQSMNIDIKWNDDLFGNKYEFITRFHEFYYWEYIEIFEIGIILYNSDNEKFEKLLLEDKNKIFLLNIVSGHMNVELSDQLIKELLASNHELKQNIGLAFLCRPIEYCINKIEQIDREKRMGFKSSGPGIREVHRDLKLNLQRLEAKLFNCDKKTRVSLIINFILVNNMYPKVFAYWLMTAEHEEDFIKEVRESKKLRGLKEVNKLLYIVSKTKLKSSAGKVINRSRLYEEFVNIIIGFIRDGKGIYTWERKDQEEFTSICKLLPVKQKHRLRKLLLNEEKGLMTSELDRLVRFEIYLKDKNRKSIINGMLLQI